MSTEVISLANSGRLRGYLSEAEYRILKSPEELEALFRLRYDAYRFENSIGENNAKRFEDAYDSMENCVKIGIYIENKLAGSVRCHHISRENRQGPAYDYFPDIVVPRVEKGHSFIDTTRFVIDRHARKHYPELAYLTLRPVCMAYQYFEADYSLAAVRKEHQAFYKRLFKAELLCDPRPYRPFKARMSLMQMTSKNTFSHLMQRYPVFISTFSERDQMFAEVDMLYRDPVNARTAAMAQ